jgi:hypothetical protein
MAKDGLRRQGCCDGHSPRSVSVLPGELKAWFDAMRLSLVTIVFRTDSELLASAVGRVFSTSENGCGSDGKTPRTASVAYLHHHQGEPNEFVREIHTRMPVIIPEEYHDAWLSGGVGKEILVLTRQTE